jgi:uncharacterized membrane protein SpoIIM required for sporulation
LTSVLDTLKIIVGKRWPLIAMIFVMEIAGLVIVANSAFFPGERAIFEKQYNSTELILNTSAVGQVGGIFVNNLKVAIFELVPPVAAAIYGLAGLAIFVFSIYDTGRVVEVIAQINGISVGLTLANLFSLPSTWLELPAYAIASAESLYLLYSIYLGFKIGWMRFVREIRFLFVNFILVAMVLILAAVFEVAEIQIETMTASAPPQDPSHAYALLTWLPFLVVFAGVIVFWRRARREAPALEERDSLGRAPDEGTSQVVGDKGLQQNEKGAAGSPTPSP